MPVEGIHSQMRAESLYPGQWTLSNPKTSTFTGDYFSP